MWSFGFKTLWNNESHKLFATFNMLLLSLNHASDTIQQNAIILVLIAAISVLKILSFEKTFVPYSPTCNWCDISECMVSGTFELKLAALPPDSGRYFIRAVLSGCNLRRWNHCSPAVCSYSTMMSLLSHRRAQYKLLVKLRRILTTGKQNKNGGRPIYKI